MPRVNACKRARSESGQEKTRSNRAPGFSLNDSADVRAHEQRVAKRAKEQLVSVENNESCIRKREYRAREVNSNRSTSECKCIRVDWSAIE